MAFLTFYFREGCHLCDDMRRELYLYVQKHSIKLVEVDIDRDAKLVELYDVKVPVLCTEDTEICHYFFDEEMVSTVLQISNK